MCHYAPLPGNTKEKLFDKILPLTEKMRFLAY